MILEIFKRIKIFCFDVNNMEKAENKIQDNNDSNVIMENQHCPICGNETLTMIEKEFDIPHFGKTSIFSLFCHSCNYHKADVESIDKNEPMEYSLEVSSPEDLNIRVIKSSTADVVIGRIGEIKSGIASNGYITNIEGILNKLEHVLEMMLDDNEADTKTVKLHLKKLRRVKAGFDPVTIKIKDLAGNSAILSEKAVAKSLKKKK